MKDRDDYPIIPQEPNWVTKYNAATDRIGGKRGEIEMGKLSKANIKTIHEMEKELASLKEVVKELIHMAENCDDIGYLNVSEVHYPEEVRKARRLQVIIDRAKRISDNK